MRKKNCLRQEGGFVLVMVLLVLLFLVFIGIAVMTTGSIEIDIAGSDKFHNTTFYAADGGVEAGAILLEHNLNCPAGFFNGVNPGAAGDDVPLGGFFVEEAALRLWIKDPIPTPILIGDATRDAFYFTAEGGTAHTNIRLGGRSGQAHGAALQQFAGYEGKGRGQAQGGIQLNYDIYAQHLGDNNSESVIQIGWRHVVGMEDEDCLY